MYHLLYDIIKRLASLHHAKLAGLFVLVVLGFLPLHGLYETSKSPDEENLRRNFSPEQASSV